MMPSTSKKQHNFMAAVANNPAFAKKVGVPQSVGQDFNKADKGRKFSKGGDMASKMNPGFMAMMAKKKEGMHKMPDGKMMKDSAMKMNSGGMPMVMKDGKKVPAFAADGKGKMKHGGAVKKMASGGMTKADMKQDKGMMQKAVNKHEGRLHKGAAMTKLAKGGGIESRGKTKGKII
jgi:hypothetical protein